MSITAPVTGQARTTAEAGIHRVFAATWLGWMLDGFDNAIYIFVIVPALSELLPASGLVAIPARIAQFGGLMFSVFMLGWACSMLWGWCADRFGRVPALIATILVYSVFTGCCGLASGIVSFGVFRFLTGFGIGGEWAAGAPLLQESVPEAQRERLAGWLHTGTPVGFLLASAAAFTVLPLVGWRGLFLLGSAPALLALWLRWGVRESPRWLDQRGRGEPRPALAGLFRGPQARSTWAAALMMTCLILGLWCSPFWIPTLVITWQTAGGATLAQAQRIGSATGFLSAGGSLVGCFAMPWIVRWLPRRRVAAAVFFAGSLLCNVVAYYGFAVLLHSFWLFLLMLPLLGFFTNGVFALFTIWLPEMFPTTHRALGSGFAFSFGRILGAFGPTAIGVIAGALHSYPVAITLVSTIYGVGLLFVLMAPETGRQTLRS